MNSQEKVLILGSAGQIGTDLVSQLRKNLGPEQVWAADVKDQHGDLKDKGHFLVLDVLDAKAVYEVISANKITQVYLLAALLSATAEQKMKSAWKLNMEGLFNLLDICRENKHVRLFWPSSIAVFGKTTPRDNTPQYTVMEPSTVYGISKQVGERWCEYYHEKFGVDVRSIRYPGLISYKAAPGGGTTDYAVDIYLQAVEKGSYTCYLQQDTTLPMMYMPDAIKATLQLMQAPPEQVRIRSSYNLAGMSFSPAEAAAAISRYIPGFKVTYKPDYRQAIADTWPRSIDDSAAREHWGWKPEYDIHKMTDDMITHITLAKKHHAGSML